MFRIKEKRGFTLVELLIVTGIMVILIGMAALITDKYFNRRAIDRFTYDMSSALTLAKLQAARQGVEYQTDCAYDSSTNTMTIQTKRGNSNTNTDFTDSSNYDIVFDETMDIDPNYTISPDSTYQFHFNPGGTSTANTINLQPTESANIKKCGSLVVTPFGRISTIVGNWDSGTSTCIAIADDQESPSS